MIEHLLWHDRCLYDIFQRQIYLKLFQAEQDDIMISVSMMIQKMLILLHLNMLKVMLFQMPTMNNSPFFHFLTQIWSDLFIPAVDSKQRQSSSVNHVVTDQKMKETSTSFPT